MADEQFRSDNHYLSQGYLRQWRGADGKVRTYSLLVRHPRVPLWKPRTVRGLAYHTHLYTRLAAGGQSDEIERWLAEEFEAPAADALTRATTDQRLTRDDWRVLVRFLAAHDVRTPAWFLRSMKRWSDTLPSLIDDVVRNVVRRREKALEASPPVNRASVSDPLVPMKTEIRPDPSGGGTIETSALLGRESWMRIMRHYLTNMIWALHEHRWTILSPPAGLSWFTSDDPVLRLQYNGPNEYDFGGGWGNRGAEIMFPLSPDHLMYTQIESRPPSRGTRMSVAQAHEVRRLIAKHAYRSILAREEDPEIPIMRSRVEDAALYDREGEMWGRFHADQVEAEKGFGV